MIHKTEIIGVSDQVHAHPKRLETMSGMTRATSQIRQALTEGGIEALDKSGVEGRPPHASAATTLSREQAVHEVQWHRCRLCSRCISRKTTS
ncbi:hypothetical protein [Ktedonobacter sp. SOSP1-52]|uniref:hypothetical protein n=1 Tax=Ktedonobacter sp. SOSP1-52 TaxID=2778366 RepID=UPI00191639CF|nr:hypothetical protein [Ktedonobacter sp. SOSP1-52]